MYGVALGLAGSEPKNVYERVAVGLLRKLSSSPAGIFVPGSGYLQTLDNKLTYSNDLTNAAWVAEFTASKSGSNILTPAVGDGVYHGTTVAAGSHTLAAQLSGSGTCTLFAYNATDHIHGETQVTLTSTPTIFAANITSTAANTFYYIGRRTGDTATSITFGGAGLFAGTYTAQQVAALGIPWTMGTASVALSLGPNKVVNGALTGTNGWTPSGAGGVKVASGATGSLYGTVTPTANAAHKMTVVVSALSGSLSPQVGNTTGTAITTTGTNSQFITPTAGTLFYLDAASTTTATVDSVAVQEILSVACPVYTDAHVYLPGSTQVSYGAELVTKGGWTTFGSFGTSSINQTTGDITFDGSEAAFSGVTTTGTVATVGKTYLVTYTVSGYVSGQVHVGMGGAYGSYVTANGTYTAQVVAVSAIAATVQAGSPAMSGVVTGISVREVITTSSVTAGLPTNNYTLSNGSTGYSAVDGTAGLVLDAAGATVQYNPATVPTNSYEGTGASTVVRTGANLTFTSAPSGDGIQLNPIYGASDTFSFVKFTASGSGSLVVFAGGSPVAFTLTGTPTQYQCGTVGNASSWLIFRSNSAGMSASITINEISGSSGIHASQATTANKPAVRRGAYNVLKQSNTFTDANWLKTNIATTAGVADPFGGTAATTLTATAASGEIYQTAADAGKPYTSGIYIRRRTGSGTVSIRNAANTAWIPLSLTSAWQLLVNDGGTTTANWYLDLQISTSGDAVDVYGAIVSPGVLSAAQILAEGGIPLTTSTAASNSGAGRYWWQSDGTNDSLYSSVAPFNQNDDWFMCSAFRCDSAAAYNVAIHSTVDATSKGPKLLVLQTTGRAALELFDGTTWASITDTVSCVGQVVVLWATQVAGVRKLWKNGTLIGSDSTALSPTACAGLRIGGGTTVGGSLFNGMLGPQMAHKGTFSDADALTLARMVASNTPNGPSF